MNGGDGMSKRYWCTKCGADPAWWLWRSGEHVGCGGRVIPIATLCSEPTVIDESDLAPGMVVVAVDDTPRAVAFMCSPDARLGGTGSRFVIAYRQVIMSDLASARYIAGPRRPC